MCPCWGTRIDRLWVVSDASILSSVPLAGSVTVDCLVALLQPMRVQTHLIVAAHMDPRSVAVLGDGMVIVLVPHQSGAFTLQL